MKTHVTHPFPYSGIKTNSDKQKIETGYSNHAAVLDEKLNNLEINTLGNEKQSPYDEKTKPCGKVQADSQDCSLKIEEEEWLTSIEAARFLKIPVGSLRNMTSNGKIPFYKLGRSNRYLRYDLVKLLLKNKRGLLYGN